MNKTKKHYRKPEIKQVKLISEEEVLSTYKNDLSTGPNQGQCLIPQCFNQGS